MQRKWIAVAMAAICMAGVATAASAQTVTLKFLGGTGSEPLSGGESAEIYPYQFSINGSNTDTSLMCISFDDEITSGETWQATVTDLSSSSSNLDKEEAYLFSLITPTTSSTTIADIQFADWYLSDTNNPNEVTETTFYKDNTNAITNYVDLAEGTKSGEGLGESDSFYEGFEIYTPAAGTYDSKTGYPDGIPQTFIGDAPCPPTSPTPEPGSLALLGTGLMGVGGVLRRRMRKQ